MSWRDRLTQLAIAGGALALTGCPTTFEPVCGNASLDPCICGRPDHDPEAKAECAAEQACEHEGGVWDPYSVQTDAGLAGRCELPGDARPPDARAPDAPPPLPDAQILDAKP